MENKSGKTEPKYGKFALWPSSQSRSLSSEHKEATHNEAPSATRQQNKGALNWGHQNPHIELESPESARDVSEFIKNISQTIQHRHPLPSSSKKHRRCRCPPHSSVPFKRLLPAFSSGVCTLLAAVLMHHARLCSITYVFHLAFCEQDRKFR